jgi:DNA-directed RNA polymerase subunit RPC12/RpoP
MIFMRKNKRVYDDDIWPEVITIAIMFLVIIGVIIGCIIIGEIHDNKKWNNGHCPVCGSEWEYEQAVGHYYSTDYVYVCNNCGRRIEIGEIR